MTPDERIKSEIEKIRKELDVVTLLNKKITVSNDLDDIEIRAAALSLISIYGGIEKVLTFRLKDKLQSNEVKNWHKELLNRSVEEQLISRDLFKELTGFLAFRHFIRHAYSFEIDKSTILNIIQRVPEIVNTFIDGVDK